MMMMMMMNALETNGQPGSARRPAGELTAHPIPSRD